MNKEQFDRSKCFTFFKSYRTQGKRIREKYGDTMTLNFYEAIIDYGLDQAPVTDDDLMLLIGDTMLETIDSSQKRRARSFGEDMEVTRSILETMRDHPEYSQENIRKIVGCSKGKVNKVINKFKAGAYADSIDFNVKIKGIVYTPTGETVQSDTVYNTNNTNNTNNNNYNNNSSDRDRDRCAVTGSDHSGGVADAPKVVANAPDSSADAARLRLPYNGRLSDSEMPDIILKTYARHLKDHELSNEEIYEAMVKEFTTGFYCCDEIPVKEACSYVCGIKLDEDFDTSSDPVTEDISVDDSDMDSTDDKANSGVSDKDSSVMDSDTSLSGSDTNSSDIMDDPDVSGSDIIDPVISDPDAVPSNAMAYSTARADSGSVASEPDSVKNNTVKINELMASWGITPRNSGKRSFQH